MDEIQQWHTDYDLNIDSSSIAELTHSTLLLNQDRRIVPADGSAVGCEPSKGVCLGRSLFLMVATHGFFRHIFALEPLLGSERTLSVGMLRKQPRQRRLW